jgi:Chlorite dismutase
MDASFIHFTGGQTGAWQVTGMTPVIGPALDAVAAIDLHTATELLPSNGTWTLRGFSSNVRYAEKTEVEQLRAIQSGLGRPEAICAALIPIRKSAAWWALAQDERRQIFEAQSHHTATGLQYLPAIARKLYHCRDIGEPFDFLTWFEYAPMHESAFDALVAALRQSPEWQYVDWEVDIRLTLQA